MAYIRTARCSRLLYLQNLQTGSTKPTFTTTNPELPARDSSLTYALARTAVHGREDISEKHILHIFSSMELTPEIALERSSMLREWELLNRRTKSFAKNS